MLAVPVGCSLIGPLFRISPVVFLDLLIVGIHASRISFTLSLLLMLKSYVNPLFDPACVPMQITINKLYLIPKRILSGVVGML